jgi:hypothetical protein
VTRLEASFIALVGVQAAHSVEEYVGRLYEVFPPAQFISGLISDDPQRGFVAFNVMLVAFGIWCALWPLRQQWASARIFAWFWVTIELVNGVGHPLWSLFLLRYTPGVLTAPVLLMLALYLAVQLRSDQDRSAA